MKRLKVNMLRINRLKVKHLYVFVCMCIFIISSMLLCACATAVKSVAPFSDATWESTPEDILKLEGECNSKYDSIYDGTTYTYSKDYLDYEGTVKYMFNKKNELMCIAWAYSADNEDVLHSLYNKLNDLVNDEHGESGYNANGKANYGNVWYLDSGDIILSTMLTSKKMALQFAYLNPAVSK